MAGFLEKPLDFPGRGSHDPCRDPCPDTLLSPDAKSGGEREIMSEKRNRSGRILRGVQSVDEVSVRDVVVAIGAQPMGFVWHFHVQAVPIGEVSGCCIHLSSPGTALLLTADGRILGSGTSRLWVGACTRATELWQAARDRGELADLGALLREVWQDPALELRLEQGSHLVRDKVHPERHDGAVGSVGSTPRG